ncbi:MAG: hypothetical protein IJ953_08435 [Campylobacter sp.]|nr:hypothetical protein [Campylobacter sp.]
MSKSFVTGFPRIGEQRELKFALESFWAGKTSFGEVEKVAAELKKRHWNYQIDAKVDLISVNDFSYYDLMLDNIVTFGAIPPRFAGLSGYDLYFSMARGNANSVAMEMTKWFNTNYHYIVPELSRDVKFNLNSSKIIAEYKEAKEAGVLNAKINLIGPITFLALSKTTDGSNALDHLDALSSEYVKLIAELSKLDNEIIIQIDEPIFVTDRAAELASQIVPIYDSLASVADNVKIIFMTYFEHANEAVAQVVKSKIWAIGLDFVHAACQEEALKLLSNSDKVLFAGLIDGRNVWVSNLDAKAEIANKIKTFIPDERLYIGTSCSLLHVPYTLKYEENLSIKEWLAFGVEKLTELKILKKLVNGVEFCETGKCLIEANRAAIASRKTSTLVNDINVQNRVKSLTKFDRDTAYEERIKIQKETFNLPDLPTTTIGSFPQTPELRQVRNAYKKSLITKESYESEIKKYIDDCIKFQEDCGLDVLVHGEKGVGGFCGGSLPAYVPVSD